MHNLGSLALGCLSITKERRQFAFSAVRFQGIIKSIKESECIKISQICCKAH